MKICWKCVLFWVGIIIATIILRRIFKPKMETKDTDISDKSKNYTDKDAMEAIKKIKNEFGTEISQRVEQIYRLETANFKSTAYRQTGSAGRLWIEKYDINGVCGLSQFT